MNWCIPFECLVFESLRVRFYLSPSSSLSFNITLLFLTISVRNEINKSIADKNHRIHFVPGEEKEKERIIYINFLEINERIKRNE